MKATSKLFDSRISATNVLIEMTISEYIDLVKDVIHKNEFQRKRVRSSKTVYALLKEDLLKQCVIPPIVLALTNSLSIESLNDTELESQLTSNKDHLVILDGLQRTRTILDLLEELDQKGDDASLDTLKETKLRVEIYVGLNRLGILYRMLTLNTGQTPMSLRQQIEMLYLDYLTNGVDGVELIREADNKTASRPNQYNFKDVVEGFNAYLDRDELPIDKVDILENINSLEKLSKVDTRSELFENYLSTLNKTISKFIDICSDQEVSKEYISEKGVAPFGKNATQIFKKPQAISGFGAAVGKMIDFGIFSDFDEVSEVVKNFSIEDPEEFLEEVNNSLYFLKNNSNKIGNAQRNFFAFFFRDILNNESDSFQSPSKANSSALRKYQAQNM